MGNCAYPWANAQGRVLSIGRDRPQANRRRRAFNFVAVPAAMLFVSDLELGFVFVFARQPGR